MQTILYLKSKNLRKRIKPKAVIVGYLRITSQCV